MVGAPNFDAEVAICESVTEARRAQAAPSTERTDKLGYYDRVLENGQKKDNSDRAVNPATESRSGVGYVPSDDNVGWIDLWQAIAAAAASTAVLAALIAFVKLKVWRWRPRSPVARIVIVAFVGWSAFVFVRTAGSIELLGIYLRQWSDDYFLLNWLLPPILAGAVLTAYRWISAAKPE